MTSTAKLQADLNALKAGQKLPPEPAKSKPYRREARSELRGKRETR